MQRLDIKCLVVLLSSILWGWSPLCAQDAEFSSGSSGVESSGFDSGVAFENALVDGASEEVWASLPIEDSRGNYPPLGNLDAWNSIQFPLGPPAGGNLTPWYPQRPFEEHRPRRTSGSATSWGTEGWVADPTYGVFEVTLRRRPPSTPP